MFGLMRLSPWSRCWLPADCGCGEPGPGDQFAELAGWPKLVLSIPSRGNSCCRSARFGAVMRLLTTATFPARHRFACSPGRYRFACCHRAVGGLGLVKYPAAADRLRIRPRWRRCGAGCPVVGVFGIQFGSVALWPNGLHCDFCLCSVLARGVFLGTLYHGISADFRTFGVTLTTQLIANVVGLGLMVGLAVVLGMRHQGAAQVLRATPDGCREIVCTSADGMTLTSCAISVRRNCATASCGALSPHPPCAPRHSPAARKPCPIAVACCRVHRAIGDTPAGADHRLWVFLDRGAGASSPAATYPGKCGLLLKRGTGGTAPACDRAQPRYRR